MGNRGEKLEGGKGGRKTFLEGFRGKRRNIFFFFQQLIREGVMCGRDFVCISERRRDPKTKYCQHDQEDPKFFPLSHGD